VPIQQQLTESNAEYEDDETKGFVGPVVIDEKKFYEIASGDVYDRLKVDDQLLPSNNKVTYESTFDGKWVYILNCKCLTNVKIIKDKLVVVHSYGGGESDREITTLLWNGKHYRNSKGEYIVDVRLYSDKCDRRRAMLHEKKVLDIAPLRANEANFVWINLMGYDGLIRYAY
jgi:hypothetical protein